ncbi:hypothetical protein DAPPUDRAFT_114147 [Daphnia pulex]|uniref:DDE-1 domain-containing protein n=1 Tax=Daphnia pulex TaxID=6669 RepID=E9HH65_DAPPU|nr:hypothetical protein DAPPUDRAFT_114147 [Daphnia pulex]|eukprot:EFX68885.1 hypothetical protein DAPPUDRAFT_114147 [Daphnia pulex]
MINLSDGFLPLACPSGWMTSELFLLSLQHLLKNIKCSPEKPILLILYNQTSHINYPVVEFCKKSGIVLFTWPPHTSHVTQPLDQCLFGPMKSDMSQEHRHWMRNHPGERISIYDMPQLTKVPYQRRFNSKNIKSTFAACVAPPNGTEVRNSLSALVSETDSQQDVLGEILNAQLNQQDGVCIDVQSVNVLPSTSTSQEDGMSHYLLTINNGKLQLAPISTSFTLIRSAVLPTTLTETPLIELPRKRFTPEEMLPHKRVAQTGPRVPKKNKNRGSSRVLTNSPDIAKLKEAHNAKVLKENNRVLKKNNKLSKVQKENNNRACTTKTTAKTTICSQS